MDKELRPEGATILRFPVRDAGRLSQRTRSAPQPASTDAGFDIDAWYHQGAVDEVRDTAKR